MANNLVLFGLSDVHIAFMTEGSESGAPIYDVPIPVRGAVGLTVDITSEETIFYADNMRYYVSNESNGGKITAEAALFGEDVLIPMLGWVKDKVGAIVEIAGGKQKPFALLGAIDGDNRGRRIIYYNCVGSAPQREYATNTQGKEVKTEKMDISVSPLDLGVDFDGRSAVTKLHMEYSLESKTAWDGFFKNVYLPEAAVAVQGYGAKMSVDN